MKVESKPSGWAIRRSLASKDVEAPDEAPWRSCCATCTRCRRDGE
jgi:hypothetical protein